MLNLILNNLDRYPLNGVIHFELKTDFPFVTKVIDMMEEKCKQFGIIFYRFKPRKSWQSLYDKYGYPDHKSRWCNFAYKADCKKQLTDLCKKNGQFVVWYIGLCADEEKRFKAELNDKNAIYRYPLAENNIIEYDIWKWAREQPIFNDYYKYNFRCGCMCCPMNSMREDAYCMTYYPEEFDKLTKLAISSEERRGICIHQKQMKYNYKYRINRIKEKYLPLKELEI